MDDDQFARWYDRHKPECYKTHDGRAGYNHVQKHIGKLLFDYVSELKSTQFREGKELQNKGIRGSQ